jgi:hypothetical protein
VKGAPIPANNSCSRSKWKKRPYQHSLRAL